MNAPITTQSIQNTALASNAYSEHAETRINEIFEQAHAHAQTENLTFTGSISPVDAWFLLQQQQAVLVDVRTHEERKFVGFVPDSIHVAWATGTSFNRNPRFVKELENKVGKDAVILLLCRSGKRSALAAEAASKAGFSHIYNVLEGFEGDLNQQQQRGLDNGWRTHNLPWQQE